MRITVLTVPGCPNAPLVEDRLSRALDGRAVEVERVEVGDGEQAARLGMTGSPTVLIDGVDPCAVPGAAASLSCRLYRGPDGRAEGAPSVADLRRALTDAEAGGDGDCPPTDAVGRGGQGRLAPLAVGLRAIQQALLRHFAATGHSPTLEDLEAAAAAQGRTAPEVVADLAADDFLALDDHGRIRAAYPFSALPTAHQVRLASGIEVYSRCAIDALGIPDMLGTDAVITSAIPVTGDTITVTSTGGQTTWLRAPRRRPVQRVEELLLACVLRDWRLLLFEERVRLALDDLAERGASVLADQAGGDGERHHGDPGRRMQD
ncbi:organomercurial lyase [Streptomyces sp. NPDC052107]|uniref:organomercurial lyase n=1 Tax=Streptomyces sp. NPDC052107 TaxID=3155632 RepID=UPI0034238565